MFLKRSVDWTHGHCAISSAGFGKRISTPPAANGCTKYDGFRKPYSRPEMIQTESLSVDKPTCYRNFPTYRPTDGDDLSLLRLLLRSVGNDDAPGVFSSTSMRLTRTRSLNGRNPMDSSGSVRPRVGIMTQTTAGLCCDEYRHSCGHACWHALADRPPCPIPQPPSVMRSGALRVGGFGP
jgi:hypothetical protein